MWLLLELAVMSDLLLQKGIIEHVTYCEMSLSCHTVTELSFNLHDLELMNIKLM
jgi:hypothetical protein